MPLLSLFLSVNVACNPLIESGNYPEAVNAASDDAEKEPLDPVTEKLSSGAVKCHTLAVNYRVRNYKFHHIADRPRGTYSAGYRANNTCNNRVNYCLKHAAIPS